MTTNFVRPLSRVSLFLYFFIPLFSVLSKEGKGRKRWAAYARQDKDARFAVAFFEQRARNSGTSECLTIFVVHC